MRRLLYTLFIISTALPSQALALSFALKWGSQGDGVNDDPAEFFPPRGVGTDGSFVYVADVENHRVQKFDMNGNFITGFQKAGGGFGSGPGEFSKPWAIRSDSSNNLWVLDKDNNRVQKLNRDSGAQLCEVGGLNAAEDITIDQNDKLWIANKNDSNMIRVSNSCVIEDTYALGFQPRGIAAFGNQLYVNSTFLVRRYDLAGNQQSEFGSGLLGNARASGVSPNGDLWITSLDNDVLTVFRNDSLLMRFGSLGAGDGELNEPHGLDFDNAGNLYVAERLNFRISKFSPSASDFGDAPSSYATTRANDGAQHAITGVFLGAVPPDAENDGQPGAMATGDDIDDASNDEDGSDIDTLVIDYSNTVSVTSSGASFLSVWVDLDGNGVFDTADRLLDGYATQATATPEDITLPIPDTASTGTSYARFRLCSSAGGCNLPTTFAYNGEVEDYKVTLVPLDEDNDGMPYYFEVENGFNPNNSSDASQDADGDGLSNVEEFNAGTDPNRTDSDGDNIPDGDDNDPTKPNTNCSGDHVTFGPVTIFLGRTVQCGAGITLRMEGAVTSKTSGGRLELFSPYTAFQPGFSFPENTTLSVTVTE